MWVWLVGVALLALPAHPTVSAYSELDADLLERLLAEQLEQPDLQRELSQPRQPAFPDITEPRQPAFPDLSPKMKQFGVNPGFPQFYGANPDFLQFRLEEVERGRGGRHDEELMVPGQPPRDPGGLGVELQKKDGEAGSKRGLVMGRADPLVYTEDDEINDIYFTTIVAVSTALAIFAVVAAGFCYHRVSRNNKTSEEVEYPAYGVTGPAKDSSPSGDRKLAQSAQMYHYQHQKNQMIAFGRAGQPGNSDNESDEGEAEEGDYTVYECPGLASTDEMEVKNPLFNDEPTPCNKTQEAQDNQQ